MTLSSTTSRAAYEADGATSAFPVPFLFADNSHIAVTLRRADGVETAWAENTHYSLTGAGEPSGGTLTALAAPTNGQTLVIRRVVPLTQETDYVENDPFPAEAHEQALDLAAMRDQQLQEQLDRTLRFPITDSSPLPELPSFADRASKLLGFDSSGDPTLFAGDASDIDTVTALGTITPRGLAERFGQVITPRDFHAIGDGTTDDTAALLATFKDGRPVMLEAGAVYKITDELDLLGYSGRVIFGATAASSPAGAPGYEHSKPAVIRQATPNKAIFRLSGSFHALSGFYLDYASQQTTSDTASVALELNNVSHSRFRNLRIFCANTSIAIPQSAYAPTSYNAIFDCIFDGIDSNSASECHLDLRNYNGGGTNTRILNFYINGGGSLDFVTAGQSANYAMRLKGFSGLSIQEPSIDGLQITVAAIQFDNCLYVADVVRFEGVKLTSNTAVWIDNRGGYIGGELTIVNLVNCRWSPSVATSMYVIVVQSTIVSLKVNNVVISSDCAFGSSGVRRVLSSSGVAENGSGFINAIEVDAIEDQGGKLSDLSWSDSISSPGPFAVRVWNRALVHRLLRVGQSATATCRVNTSLAPPTGGGWAIGDYFFNAIPGDIGRPGAWRTTTAGSPGTQTPEYLVGDGGGTSWGDVAVTLTPQVSRKINIWIVALTADRTVTLSTTGVWPGCTFRIARPATGAFNLTVGAVVPKVLATGDWCDVTWDGFNWRTSASNTGV